MTDTADRPPLVTIGMPVYDGARYLEGAVRSLLAQTERDLLLLISDNASTDETPAICARLMAEDGRIRYVRQVTNIGPAKNFESVLRRTRSPFFMWAAHDDLHHPEFLQDTLHLLQESPSAFGCAVAEQVVDEDGKALATVVPSPALADSAPSLRIRALIHEDNGEIIYGLFRREAFPPDWEWPDIHGGEYSWAFGFLLRSPLVVSDRVLITKRLVGFDVIPDAAGILVPRKELGATRHLHLREPHGMHREMLRHTARAPLLWHDKLTIGALVLKSWQFGVRSARYETGDRRIQRARLNHRRLLVALLRAEHFALKSLESFACVKRRLLEQTGTAWPWGRPRRNKGR